MTNNKKHKYAKKEDLLAKYFPINLNIVTVELKEVCGGDNTFLRELSDKNISSKDFCVEFLASKTKNEENSKLIKNLSNEDLKNLIEKYLDGGRYLKIDYEDMGNIFDDFKTALIRHNLEEESKFIEEFNFKYPIFSNSTLDLVESTIKTMNRNLIQSMPIIQETIHSNQKMIEDLYKPITDAYNIIHDSIIPQMESISKWTESNQYIFNVYSSVAKDFLEKFESPLSGLSSDLTKYQWFISPSLDLKFIFYLKSIIDNSNYTRKDLNKAYCDYFSKNNFQKLDLWVSNWKSVGILGNRRMKLIENCVNLLKYNKHVNPSYLIVPSLITQIDGIEHEFLDEIGMKREDFLSNCSDSLSESAKEIFLEVLYEKVYPKGSISHPINFSRHKIVHGEHTNGFTKFNIIRCFLILDFIITVYVETKSNQNSEDD